MTAQQQGKIFARSSTSSNNLVLIQSSNSASGNAALAAVQRHQAFYATVQALLYLLCYHLQPLLLPQQQGPQQQQLAAAVTDLVKHQVLPLLAHQLAPLAVCHEAVTSEFVRQAMMLGLADATWEAAAVEAVRQHQAAVEAAVSAGTAVIVGDSVNGASAASKVLRPLEVFFPFDPYLLQRSSRFLELPRSYICFSHGHPHVSGDLAAAAADSGSDEGSESEEEAAGDEEALLRHAAAVVAAGTTPPRGMQEAADDEGSDDSSSTTSDDPDAEDLDRSLPATAAAAAGLPPAGITRQGSRQPRAGVVPVGFAGVGRGSLSGPSPPADLMATSLVGAQYMGAVSYSPGEAMGMSPLIGGGMIGGGMLGGSPLMGGSPMAMSYQEGYMQNVAQLHAGAQ